MTHKYPPIGLRLIYFKINIKLCICQGKILLIKYKRRENISRKNPLRISFKKNV
jgi:hypothetical protein